MTAQSHRPDRLALAKWEADRHAAVLAEALALWTAQPVSPSLEDIESLSSLRQAHEYPDAPELRHAQLLAAIAGAAGLLDDYRSWAEKLPR